MVFIFVICRKSHGLIKRRKPWQGSISTISIDNPTNSPTDILKVNLLLLQFFSLIREFSLSLLDHLAGHWGRWSLRTSKIIKAKTNQQKMREKRFDPDFRISPSYFQVTSLTLQSHHLRHVSWAFCAEHSDTHPDSSWPLLYQHCKNITSIMDYLISISCWLLIITACMRCLIYDISSLKTTKKKCAGQRTAGPVWAKNRGCMPHVRSRVVFSTGGLQIRVYAQFRGTEESKLFLGCWLGVIGVVQVMQK